jgi:hypothetical protein
MMKIFNYLIVLSNPNIYFFLLTNIAYRYYLLSDNLKLLKTIKINILNQVQINKHKILSIRILIYIMPTLLFHHRKRLTLSK